MQWLAEICGPHLLSNEKVAAAAADCGDEDMLTFLHSRHPPPSWDLCYDAAMRNADLDTLEWLRKHFCTLSPGASIIPISQAPGKVVPWMADCLPMRTWLQDCSPGRMLYLVKRGWVLPNAEAYSRLQAAQASFCAFHGTARWLAKQQSEQPTLGSLSNDLLRRIACEAEIDFWAIHSDLSRPSDGQEAIPGRVNWPEDLTGEECIDTDDDWDYSTNASSSSFSHSDGLADAFESLSMTDGCAKDINWDELQEEGQEGSLWLAQCIHGADCSDEMEDDPDWLPDVNTHLCGLQ